MHIHTFLNTFLEYAHVSGHVSGHVSSVETFSVVNEIPLTAHVLFLLGTERALRGGK